MAKAPVYHVGDLVRIVNCRPIKRVGYPLYAPDLYTEFEGHPRLAEALKMLGVMGDNQVAQGWAARDAVRGLAMAAVRFRKWGGPERTIHYLPVRSRTADPDCFSEGSVFDCTGHMSTVLAKRTQMTGTYFAPWSGYDSYSGEHDYEPGGLSNAKAHVILTTGFGDFEACDVEMVMPDA